MLTDRIAQVIADHQIDTARPATPTGWDALAWCSCQGFRASFSQDPAAVLTQARLHIAEQIIAAIEASQPDHLIEFTVGGWVIEHSMACRLGGRLFDCPFTVAAGKARPAKPGRYRCTLAADGRLVIGEATDRA